MTTMGADTGLGQRTQLKDTKYTKGGVIGLAWQHRPPLQMRAAFWHPRGLWGGHPCLHPLLEPWQPGPWWMMASA